MTDQAPDPEERFVRVDFRDLVRDLQQHLHARVEMRQIGARDGAKAVGGIGSCGRELCCTTFLPLRIDTVAGFRIVSNRPIHSASKDVRDVEQTHLGTSADRLS